MSEILSSESAPTSHVLSDAERLEAIRSRLSFVTAGPWSMEEFAETGECMVVGGANVWYPQGESVVCSYAHYDDAEFLANSRADLEWTMERLAEQAVELASLRERHVEALTLLKETTRVGGTVWMDRMIGKIVSVLSGAKHAS
jgi:hypothetical protein